MQALAHGLRQGRKQALAHKAESETRPALRLEVPGQNLRLLTRNGKKIVFPALKHCKWNCFQGNKASKGFKKIASGSRVLSQEE